MEVGTLLFVDLDGKEPMFTDLEKEALKTFRGNHHVSLEQRLSHNLLNGHPFGWSFLL